MSRKRVRQVIQVGNHQIPLPEGVTAADWGLEKATIQNPRIRSFLGCIRLLEGVLESNYAILHCSPERLLDIWTKVRQVSELIRTQLGPLLQMPSKIPKLEEARQSAALGLDMLSDHVLADLDRFPAEVPPDQVLELRKLLCVSIGQLHAFLQDTFGHVMAGDPRSLHDADYFLSRRFPQDIEEAEWLHSTVERLRDYLQALEDIHPRHLSTLAETLRREEAVPTRQAWKETAELIDELLKGLTLKLKEVLALRGVRFYEMELLDRHAIEIPIRCRLVTDLYATGLETVAALKETQGESRQEREQNVRDLLQAHAVLSGRLAARLEDLDANIRDLLAFLPLWLKSIEKRRALLLKRGIEEFQS
ncbi:MAG TPA: hypothetical protein VHN15_08785, partial [Thermoanaerobaculia bacterium]|nr:hypothetical protein [Thermoanaerobaculia bacterium]